MTNPDKDFYKLLGVTEKSTPKEIRSAYHKMAKKLHPDRNPGNKEAERKFKDANEAYETLSDTKKRQQYDQLRDLAARGFRFPGGAGGARPDQFDASQFTGFGFGKEGGMGGLADLFEMFTQQGRPAGASGPRRTGDDIRAAADVPIGIAARGGSIALTLEGSETCPVCRGSGGGNAAACPQCHGTGKSSGLHGLPRPCVRCGGEGHVPAAACSRCGGRGEIPEQRRLSVKVPPGTRDGTEMRLPKQGSPGPAGPGDLLLKFRIVPEGDFRLDGADTVRRARISVFQAILGATLEIATVVGENLRIKVPPGTQPGTRLRLKGKGLASGDMLVEIDVRVPTRLTPPEREQIERLAGQLGERE